MPQLSSRDKAYQSDDKRLREFYSYDFDFSSFSRVIEDRKKFPVDRELLVMELKRTYEKIEHSDLVAKNIESLANENTFTVITAHQPSLFTGPFYYILKIASAINLAARLSIENDCKVVPIFILGAEDHDLEEVNHTYIFNNKIEWTTDQKGSVGRMNKNGLDAVISAMTEILGAKDEAIHLGKLLLQANQSSETYGEFCFQLIHLLFNRFGLLIANFDNTSFKKSFVPLIEKEVFQQFSKAHITSTQEKLIASGFSDQAYAREINFFYLQDGLRSRIEETDSGFTIVDTDIRFSKEEMKSEIINHPDRFSPNVIMRPLFQETIMPNLAYIGGGGELAYWMERKSQFEEAGVFFPLLVRRNSALWISKRAQKQFDKLGVTLEDLLKETNTLLKDFALEESDHEIDFSESIQSISEAYSQISKLASSIDGSLHGTVEAMLSNQNKAIEKLQQRLVKKIKQNQEIKLNQLRKLQDLIFPDGGLQERRTNFMEFYLSQGEFLLDFLVENCNPFEKGFMVIKEQDRRS